MPINSKFWGKNAQINWKIQLTKTDLRRNRKAKFFYIPFKILTHNLNFFSKKKQDQIASLWIFPKLTPTLHNIFHRSRGERNLF